MTEGSTIRVFNTLGRAMQVQPLETLANHAVLGLQQLAKGI